jgi:thiamine transport system ATP-binding protein
LREQLAVELAEVLRSAKITTLLVTHDQEEAFTLADRVAVLRAGEVRQIGAVREVWRRPADEDTAAFLGVTTFFDGEVTGGVVRFALGELTVEEPDGAVRVGLRPHALHPAAHGVPGEILAKVHRRDHVRLRVRTTAGTVDAVAPVDADLNPGDEIRLALDEQGVVLTKGGS